MNDQVQNKNVVKVLDSSEPADGKYGKLDVFFEGEKLAIEPCSGADSFFTAHPKSQESLKTNFEQKKFYCPDSASLKKIAIKNAG